MIGLLFQSVEFGFQFIDPRSILLLTDFGYLPFVKVGGLFKQQISVIRHVKEFVFVFVFESRVGTLFAHN